MPKVWNPTEEHIKDVKCFGNYFSFAPGAMKNMQEHIARFIETNKKETGLVALYDEFDPMNEEKFVEGFDKTPKGKEILAEKKLLGLRNLIDFHTAIVYNNQVSLKKDWAIKDPSNDPGKLAAISASKGELESMRLVAKYNKLKLNDQEKQITEVDKLMSEIGSLESK